ncbi:MAG: FAD:protein FMN transferase [Pseudorhodobacter sp.]|nr:FAD:protein FMN transferase [Pseudorhodobacter sp.]
MTHLTRRRFLAISAAAPMLAGLAGLPAHAAAVTRWQGVAMGAAASIRLAHPDAKAITARVWAEIDRLENIFSLHRPDSALTRLNATGRLDAPPFELLECLSLCDAVHRASGGLFDPTIQPLWQLYATRHATGHAPEPAAIAEALTRVGWQAVAFDATAVRLVRPGMALSLNGVAQGYVADRVAALLAAEGLTDILVDTGEFRAIGGQPGGGDWPISLQAGARLLPGTVALRDQALASSAPRGTVFDAAGRVGHILNPLSGAPAQSTWGLISVTAPHAALADALSTAMCLMSRTEITALLQVFPAAGLAGLSESA